MPPVTNSISAENSAFKNKEPPALIIKIKRLRKFPRPKRKNHAAVFCLAQDSETSSSHFLQSSSTPNFSRLPSSLKTHSRVAKGGLWRTCRKCPQASSARQSPSSSLSKLMIFRFISRANIRCSSAASKPVSTTGKSKAQSASRRPKRRRAAKAV